MSIRDQDYRGGSAFPVATWDEEWDERRLRYETRLSHQHPGMSLRDYFAGQALVGLTSEAPRDPEHDAMLAYKYADAMLKARSEKDA